MHEDNGFTAVRDWKVCLHLKRSRWDNFEVNVGRLMFTDGNIGDGFLLQKVLK